jgi:hypothetical protein
MKNLIASQITEGQTPVRVTVAELSLILQRVDGSSATFISMVTATIPSDMRKTGNPYADKDTTVHKVSKYGAQINFNYTNAVNNQLEREGKEADFEAQMNWHKKKFDEFNGCVCSKMEGDQRQEYLFFRNMSVERIGFAINGVEATTEQTEIIKSFIPKKAMPTNQGTEKAILVQTIKLQNIKLLKLNGQYYEVVS